jgi:hypothetical protein
MVIQIAEYKCTLAELNGLKYHRINGPYTEYHSDDEDAQPEKDNEKFTIVTL